MPMELVLFLVSLIGEETTYQQNEMNKENKKLHGILNSIRGRIRR